MALDDTTDPQIAAVAALAGGAVNAALADVTTEPAIRRVYTWPITRARAPQLQLPALAVYRFSDREQRRTIGRTETEVTIRFDYWASATPLDRIELRWPLLRSVWEALVNAVLDGAHESVSEGAQVLELAGFVAIDRSSPTVRYIAAEPEEAVYPRFEGTIVARHREDFDRSELALFLELHGGISRADGNPEIQPQVRFIANETDG